MGFGQKPSGCPPAVAFPPGHWLPAGGGLGEADCCQAGRQLLYHMLGWPMGPYEWGPPASRPGGVSPGRKAAPHRLRPDRPSCDDCQTRQTKLDKPLGFAATTPWTSGSASTEKQGKTPHIDAQRSPKYSRCGSLQGLYFERFQPRAISSVWLEH